MLKTLANVIKICTICFAVFFLISLLLELLSFPQWDFLKQFSLGSACSFIVLLISTYVQYKAEFNKAFSNYISNTSQLILTINLCHYDHYNKEQIEFLYNELDKRFRDYKESRCRIMYLLKKSEHKFEKKNYIIDKMYILFLIYQMYSREKAVKSVVGKDKLILAIDTYLEYWPNCYEKDQIAIIKKCLQKENEEKQNN